MTKIYEGISRHFAELSYALLTVDRRQVEAAIGLLREVKEVGGTVWVAGNGGSAATASHFANDLTKIASVKAIALPDLVPTVLAYGNDEGWENMFRLTMKSLYNPEIDAFVGISCSGNSANVVMAAELLPPERVIALIGQNDDCDLAMVWQRALIMAPTEHITVQEDVHTAICHAIARTMKENEM